MRAQSPNFRDGLGGPRGLCLCFRPRLLSPFAKPSYTTDSASHHLPQASAFVTIIFLHLTSITNPKSALNPLSLILLDYTSLASSLANNYQSGDCNFFKRNNSCVLWINYLSQPTQQLFNLSGLISFFGLAQERKETPDRFDQLSTS